MRRYYVNPGSDEAFSADVHRLGALHASPSALEAELRARYPAAVVRRRDLTGSLMEVWYVYREGSWRPPDAQGG